MLSHKILKEQNYTHKYMYAIFFILVVIRPEAASREGGL